MTIEDFIRIWGFTPPIKYNGFDFSVSFTFRNAEVIERSDKLNDLVIKTHNDLIYQLPKEDLPLYIILKKICS